MIADADTGYGNALNVVRTVREYEKAGVAGLHIEDQVSPKKCGHIAGKQVIPTEEFCDKIRAASEYRTDPDFVIIARTDARAVTSLEDAIDRGNRYAQAGADLIFFEAPQTEDEIRRVAREIKALPGIERMVLREGRAAILKPLFRCMLENEWTRDLVRPMFETARERYHPITVAVVDALLTEAGV